MTKRRPGSQISIRVPPFVHERLEELREAVATRTGERKPSQPEIVAALIWEAQVTKLSRAMKTYRLEARRRVTGAPRPDASQRR